MAAQRGGGRESGVAEESGRNEEEEQTSVFGGE